jgi:peptidyl-prolyl cis-trans isomerase SurA
METDLKSLSAMPLARAALVACLWSATLATPMAQAQTVGDDPLNAPASGLDLPANITLLGKADPNIRKATAVVNGAIITETDVQHRLALVVLANGGKVAEAEVDRLRLQVLRNLIDETLQIQEAAAKDIKADKAEVEQSYARVAGNFRYTPTTFGTYLQSKGSSAASIKRQIEGELVWNRLLRSRIQPFVNVSEDEVRSVMDRLKQARGTDEVHLGEIYLSATPENSEQVARNLTQILEQIRGGGSFPAYARQYSEASTKVVGGDLGWVRPAQLPEELAVAAGQLNVGQIAGPIAVPGGYSLIYVMDKRKVLTADPRDSTLSLKQMGINFAAGMPPAQAQAKAKQFSDAVKNIQGCGSVGAIAQQVGGDVVENDGIRIRDLPPQLQEILLNLQIGQSTPPFGSLAEGVRVLVLCGRDDPQDASGPTFDQIMSQMEDERVNKRARIYLRDLRRDAVIDYN